MMDFERAQRTLRILGKESFSRLASSRVLVCGVGGVGGYAAEHLIRSGVGKLTIVDGDTVDVSNINRQIAALSGTIGKYKCDVLKNRFIEINESADIAVCNKFIKCEQDIAELLDNEYDFVIDAIDDVPAKIELIAGCVNRSIPLISSMGAAGKLDISRIKIADISKTTDCPLARAVRRKLRERGINKGVLTVFSTEETISSSGTEKPGSLSHIVSTFGAYCAQSAIECIIQQTYR